MNHNPFESGNPLLDSTSSGTALELETYLAQYPNGRFAAIARTRLTALKIPPPAPVPARPSEESLELAYWESIKGSSVIPELEAYLTQYPNGRFATLVNARIAALRAPPPEPSRVTAAPVLPRPILLGSPLDGRYRASIAGATWSAQELSAELEIDGTRVTGQAMREGQPRPCRIEGTINEDGTLRPGVRIECDQVADAREQSFRFPAITISLDGRFTRTADGSDIVGETAFRSSEGRTGNIRWQKIAAARPRAAVMTSTLDGRYAATLRNTHPLTSVYIQSSFDVAGGQIRGTGHLYPDVVACPLSGTVETDGTANFTLGCSANSGPHNTVKSTHTVKLTGRFTRSASGAIAIDTVFQSNTGQRGTTTWERQE